MELIKIIGIPQIVEEICGKRSNRKKVLQFGKRKTADKNCVLRRASGTTSEQDSLSCSFSITKEQRLDCLLFLYRKKFFDTFCEIFI